MQNLPEGSFSQIVDRMAGEALYKYNTFENVLPHRYSQQDETCDVPDLKGHTLCSENLLAAEHKGALKKKEVI